MPSSSPDDFAPHGSDRRRSGLNRGENLPPGRRNQSSPTPADPTTGALRRLSELQGQEPAADGPRARARAAKAARQAPAKTPAKAAAPRLAQRVPVQEVEPDELEEALADSEELAGEFYGESTDLGEILAAARAADPATALAEALMFALRLRIAGEGDAGTWEQFDVLAEQALLTLAPRDPFQDMPPAVRFLWGETGLMRMPDEVSEADEIADVLRLGAPGGGE